MAILNILKYPHENLHKVAVPVQKVDDSIRSIVADMLETMYEANGIGLAATQVDIHQQIVVIDISEEKNSPLMLINPVITYKEGLTEYQEGCLSVPGIYEIMTRAEIVTVTALDVNGEFFELNTDGLLAICIQHELDHLQGKVFVDYLSQLKQKRIKTKLLKQAKKED